MKNKRPKYYWLLIPMMFVISGSLMGTKIRESNVPALVRIIFVNNVEGKKIALNDSIYINPFGEKYSITKLRYYVTNVGLKNEHTIFREEDSYHLVDESKPESQIINITVPADNYSTLNFLLGVDSLHNVSGAQTGDLDPANDMFWTWNTGYVMAKLEGHSPSSALVNNKFEYHIGGFSGLNNVLKEIHLTFPETPIHFQEGKPYVIIINADINAWWQHPHDIKITSHPAITSPGENAKDISDNYAHMFHIEKIISN
jgi:MbnP